MFKVYTDGGARGNGKADAIGAWAFVVYQGHQKKGTKSAWVENTTNNFCELTAVVEAAKWAKKLGKHVTIFTDSAYVCNGFNQWMHGWKNRMWKTSGGGRVKNLELWRDLYHLSKEADIDVEKVKGHAGDGGNELADTLCNVKMDEWELENKVMR